MSLKFSGKQDVYLEIAERFEDYIRRGLYPLGEKLPSVRTVAADMGVNPNTVAKAYRALSDQGVIETRGKQGTFIASGTDPVQAQAEQAATAFAHKVRSLGYSDTEIVAMVESALRGA